METMVAAGFGPHVKVKVSHSLADPSMATAYWVGQVLRVGVGADTTRRDDVGGGLKGVLPVVIGLAEGERVGENDGNGKHAPHRTRTVRTFGFPKQGSADTPKDWRVTTREAEWRPRNVDDTREEIVP